MNIFNKVTIQSLIKNKTRTIVTIIGIILSASMICAVTTFASSIYNYALRNAIYIYGDWHGSSLNGSFKTYKDIMGSGKVNKVVYGQQLGYSKAEGCVNQNKPYIYLLGASKGFEKTMPVHITSGKFPESSNEILLPIHLSSNGGVKHSLGDKITLSLGNRVDDGFVLTQDNPFITTDDNGDPIKATEKIEIRETRTYIVVGFYERPSFEKYTAPGYTALTVADKEVSDSACLDIYFKMKKPKDVYSFMEDNKINGSFNSTVLTYSGVSQYNGFNTMIASLAAIIIGLIMFGSIALIYNAFAISVSERTKQFGLLSSVGATKKQLKNMVLFEALTVSAIGIPIGVLAGVGGIGITLLFIGHKFESIIGYQIPPRVSVSPLSISIAIGLALITVLISAWIPTKRAARVSAIEAIRQSQDISVKAKKVRTSKLTYKLFGLPGMLASKYYKRSKKRYRATVLSLFMSIVLFVSASSFTGYLTESVAESLDGFKYDIAVFGSEDCFQDVSLEELLQSIKNDTGVKEVFYSKSRSYQATIATENSTKDFVKYYADSKNIAVRDVDFVSTYINIEFVDETAFDNLLKKYDLDKAKFTDKDNPLAIALDGRLIFDEKTEKFIKLNIFKTDSCELTISAQKEIEGYYLDDVSNENGNSVYIYKNSNKPDDELRLSEDEAIVTNTFNVAKVIYDPLFYTDANSSLIYPISLFDSVISKNMGNSQKFRTSLYATSDSHSESEKAIKETLINYKLVKPYVFNYAKQAEEDRNMVTIIQVFSYGFIVLISLIAAANVFNTISTNISLRRREFAMLKSVGMTAKGFNKMMNFECLLYGIRALLYGLPVSAGVTYLIHLAVSEGYSIGFHLPWMAIGIAVLSVFAVVFSTMLYSMSKIKKDNLIDALKNENL
jgi:putative ABC transport system permease protein